MWMHISHSSCLSILIPQNISERINCSKTFGKSQISLHDIEFQSCKRILITCLSIYLFVYLSSVLVEHWQDPWCPWNDGTTFEELLCIFSMCKPTMIEPTRL